MADSLAVERDLKECFDCSEATFAISDDGQPILRHVKVLGTVSQNDREYTLEAKTNGLPLYENAKVNINHPSDPHKSRDFQDRFGFIRRPIIENRDIYGDLYFNPEHPWAKPVIWWAKNAPECLGLSHNAVGQGRDENGRFIVDKIVKVRSVDLVADPATTKSLFESINMADTPPKPVVAPVPEAVKTPVKPVKEEDETPPNPVASAGGGGSVPTPQSIEHKIGHLVSEIIKDPGLSRSAKRKKLLTATKLLPDAGEPEEPDETSKEKPAKKEEAKESAAEDEKKEKEDAGEKDEKKKKEVEESNKKLLLCEQILQKIDKQKAKVALELDALKARAVYLERLSLGKKLCAEAKLPELIVTDEFLRNLAESADEAGMKVLIEDRQTLANVPKPKPPAHAQPQKKASEIATKDFVESLNAY